MFRLSRRGTHPPFEVSGPRGSMAGSPTRTTGRRALPGGSAIEVTGRAIEVTGPPKDPSGAPTRASGSPPLVTDRRGSMTVSPMEMPAMPTRWPASNMIGTVMELGSESLPSESSSRRLRWQDVSTIEAPAPTERRTCFRALARLGAEVCSHERNRAGPARTVRASRATGRRRSARNPRNVLQGWNRRTHMSTSLLESWPTTR